MDIEPSIRAKKSSRVRYITSLKTCNVKKNNKSPMSKMQKKVDEGNERINQMSVSESENI